MTPTTKLTPAAGLATLMWFAPAPDPNGLAALMLSRIVEAHASAMEANDLLAAGVIPARTIRRGLTLEQAQAHCRNPETSSQTATGTAARRRTQARGPWFDSYDDDRARA